MLFYAKIDLEISEETGLDNLCPEEIIEMYVLEDGLVYCLFLSQSVLLCSTSSQSSLLSV